MADLFVSMQNGNDANLGTSVPQAWATIGKAVGEVAAGNTVYIGPGTYRERVVLATAGTAGNEITWIPDPEAQYLTSDNPGIVRVTGCGVDELPTAGNVWTMGVNYNILGDSGKKWNQIYIDGSSDLAAVNALVAGQTVRECYGVNATSSQNGFSYSTKTDYCIVTAGRYAFGSVVAANYCIGIGGDRGFTSVTLATNCVGGGGIYPFISCSGVNCLAFGGSVGFYGLSGVSTYTNCIAVGGTTAGFRGQSTTLTLQNCTAIACQRAVFGDSEANVLDTSTVTAVYCFLLQRGVTWETHTPAAAKSVSYNLLPMLEMLKPLLQFEYNLGNNAASAGDYDILGQARRLIDGTIDIGPYAHSDVTNNFTESDPALEFTQAGMQKFVFWAEGGSAFTKKVQVKWANYAGANKPQIIVDGDHVTRGTGTAVGDGVAYEEISVTATPDADGEVELFLYARDTDAAAKTYFKELE